ncbi:MAG: hypothetical protein QXF17_06530 [Ignisphaera sp.]
MRVAAAFKSSIEECFSRFDYDFSKVNILYTPLADCKISYNYRLVLCDNDSYTLHNSGVDITPYQILKKHIALKADYYVSFDYFIKPEHSMEEKVRIYNKNKSYMEDWIKYIGADRVIVPIHCYDKRSFVNLCEYVYSKDINYIAFAYSIKRINILTAKPYNNTTEYFNIIRYLTKYIKDKYKFKIHFFAPNIPIPLLISTGIDTFDSRYETLRANNRRYIGYTDGKVYDICLGKRYDKLESSDKELVKQFIQYCDCIICQKYINVILNNDRFTVAALFLHNHYVLNKYIEDLKKKNNIINNNQTLLEDYID